jgi:inosine-uridine nucleoside N-ribohydrolase
MQFPTMTEDVRLKKLQPPTSKVRMVLDTDTYNEIDDQFAVVYALLSPEKLNVEALYAAPFHNNRSNGAADGMEKSYEEILRLLEKLDYAADNLVYRGSTAFLNADLKPQENDAVNDLIQRALASSEDDPLYVVAIGAITNIASAILKAPEIVTRIVVVWLGGHALYWPNTREFNLHQDIHASRLIFDCGVPLVLIPCSGVTTHLFTTLSELNDYVRGRGAIGDYLVQIYEEYMADHFGRSKVIWDIATIAYLINAEWTPTDLVHSPILTDQITWSFDPQRHFIRSANYIHRDPIFRDLFMKLETHSK